MEAFLILPFLIELFGDAYLISRGKKDIPSFVRIIMILIVVSLLIDGSIVNSIKDCIISTLPYVLFDLCLNILRGKPILYTGKTKMYDLFLAKFPSWVVLVGRFIFAGVLLLIYYCL